MNYCKCDKVEFLYSYNGDLDYSIYEYCDISTINLFLSIDGTVMLIILQEITIYDPLLVHTYYQSCVLLSELCRLICDREIL
jgi:hypothetical protein